eukprot:2604446-Prymnesium_polylepis.1
MAQSEDTPCERQATFGESACGERCTNGARAVCGEQRVRAGTVHAGSPITRGRALCFSGGECVPAGLC